MSTLPLFPLGSVLVPGQILTLNIFEDRYLRLVDDLESGQWPKRHFGVVMITAGHEVGSAAAVAIAEVGTIAQVRKVERLPGGTIGLTVAGRNRFRVVRRVAGSADGPGYDTAEVEELPPDPQPHYGESTPAALELLADRASACLYRLLELLGRPPVSQLPVPPPALSWSILLIAPLPVADVVRLLAIDDLTERLEAEIAVLQQECVLLQQTRTQPRMGPASLPPLS